MWMKSVLVCLVTLLTVSIFISPATAHQPNEEDGIHRLAMQISDNDPAKMKSVLDVSANVSRYYSNLGEEVEIKIVVFNGGIHMLRKDTSPVSKRLQSFAKGMPNVTFLACDNTLQAMARKEGKPPEVFDFSEHVTAGVVALMQLNESGWTIVRP